MEIRTQEKNTNEYIGRTRKMIPVEGYCKRKYTIDRWKKRKNSRFCGNSPKARLFEQNDDTATKFVSEKCMGISNQIYPERESVAFFSPSFFDRIYNYPFVDTIRNDNAKHLIWESSQLAHSTLTVLFPKKNIFA